MLYEMKTEGVREILCQKRWKGSGKRGSRWGSRAEGRTRLSSVGKGKESKTYGLAAESGIVHSRKPSA